MRVLLALDRRGALRFAPLGGETFRALVPAGARAGLPDSLVLRTADGRLLVRSGAVVESLRRTSGLGTALAVVVALLPTALADRLYDQLARVRRLVFRAPADACPVADPARRARFLP